MVNYANTDFNTKERVNVPPKQYNFVKIRMKPCVRRTKSCTNKYFTVWPKLMLCCYNEVFVWLTGEFWILEKSLCLCWELICTRITHPPQCLHIHICTSIFSQIDVYKEIFRIFHYFILTLISKEIYTIRCLKLGRAEWDISNYNLIYH